MSQHSTLGDQLQSMAWTLGRTELTGTTLENAEQVIGILNQAYYTLTDLYHCISLAREALERAQKNTTGQTRIDITLALEVLRKDKNG